MRVKSLLAGLLALCIVLSFSASAPAQSSKLSQLKLAVSTATPHNTPLWVAKGQENIRKVWARCPDVICHGRIAR